MSENIKLAVVQKYLCDGELARHLNLQSGRLTTYELARKEAINYLRAKQTWTLGTADPMDLSPLGKGKGGNWQEEILRRKMIRNSCTCTWPRRLPPLRRGQ